MLANISTILPFDAQQTKTLDVVYTWASGKSVTGFKVIIFDKECTQRIWTSLSCIDNFETTGVYTLPNEAIKLLTNGKSYRIIITSLIDGKEDVITKTDGKVFTCYKTPTIRFLNLVGQQLGANGTFTFEIEYEQDEGMFLSSATLDIYTLADREKPYESIDFPRNQIMEGHKNVLGNISTQRYCIDATRLQTNRIYYVKLRGIVQSAGAGQMAFQTNMYQFEPFDESGYGVYDFLTARNDKISGGIVLGTHIVSVNGVMYDRDNKKIVIETYDGTVDPKLFKKYQKTLVNGENAVDLRSGRFLNFFDGWVASQDFTIILYTTHSVVNDKVFEMSYNVPKSYKQYDDEPTISTKVTVHYREGYNGEPNITGYYDMEVETKYEQPKTEEPKRDPSYYKRVYHSANLSRCSIEKYSDRTLAQLSDFTWNQLITDIVPDNEIVVLMISRKQNEWAFEAKKYKDFDLDVIDI